MPTTTSSQFKTKADHLTKIINTSTLDTGLHPLLLNSANETLDTFESLDIVPSSSESQVDTPEPDQVS